MDKKIRIYIQVGESKFPLWINPKEEPIFREAARTVNRRMVNYNTKYRGAHLSDEQVLAMTAFDLAVICQRHDAKPSDATAEAELTDIVSDLSHWLADDRQTTVEAGD